MKNQKSIAKSDRIIGLVAIIISIFFFAGTMNIQSKALVGDPGPKLFPYIGCILTAFCGIALLIKPSDHSEEALRLTAKEWWRAGLLLAVYCLFIFMMWFIGFKFVLPILAFTVSFMFTSDKQNKKKALMKCLLFTAIVSIAVYIVYVFVFEAKFPSGYIWELLQ